MAISSSKAPNPSLPGKLLSQSSSSFSSIITPFSLWLVQQI
jgi:hypothetical protein